MFHTRILIAVMTFTASFITYLIRAHISVFLVAMVTNSEGKAPNYGPRYDWSEVDQANIISAFYYGYALSNFISGILAQNYGGRNVFGFTILISGILIIISPKFAGPNYKQITILRFISGLFAGTCFSSCHDLISKWAPPNEKGKFVATLMGGGSLGTVVTFPLTTMLIDYFKWPVAFYIEGIFVITFVPVWYLLVSNEPKTHWFINPDEVNYINETLASTITSSKKCPPYAKMFTSIPYLALICVHFGNVWGLMLISTYIPKYMNQVLDYNFTNAGFLSSLPSLGRFIMAFISGSIGDCIRRKEILSVTYLRKICCVSSHIIPGIIMCILAFWIMKPWIAVILITLSLSFNGTSVAGHHQNFQDLAPNYASSLVGTADLICSISGFLVPIMVSYFTKENNTQKEWSKIYMISGAFYIIPAMFFILLGTGKVQKWNYDQPTPDGKSSDEKIKN